MTVIITNVSSFMVNICHGTSDNLTILRPDNICADSPDSVAHRNSHPRPMNTAIT